MGYVGPAVARLLRERHPDATIDGFDTGFFRDCLTPEDASPEQYLDHQHFGDIRSIDPGLLRNRDAVIHLAAISNDPMGNRFEKVRSEEHTSELQSLMRISYAVFCLKKKKS